ncbi:peptidase [Macrococcoides caseolyticum]|uniref:peptidase n=1 Tax=Macrococcoides caseolyticum TaxID=69966 RepID=UPI00105FFB84|nr:peptidase [Macrococcus caseolyticus]TDM28785.1 peptidase [Macrococcus caseolyticus]
MRILKYEDNDFEIICQKKLYIKDKHKLEYFQLESKKIDTLDATLFYPYKEKLSKNFIYFFLTLIMVLFIYNYINVSLLQKEIGPLPDTYKTVFVMASYFIINLILHELSHILSLKLCGKKFNKVGIKLNYYIFPSFYVQMNEIYMLSKNEKIFVHISGILTNLIFMTFIQYVNIRWINDEALTRGYMYFMLDMVWNIAPFLNSDGYKTLITLLDMDEFTDRKENSKFIKIIQLLSILMVLHTVFNWILFYL